MSTADSQIRAILSLLSDDDSEIVGTVRKKLLGMNEDLVRDVLGAAESGSAAEREARWILRKMQEPSLESQFRSLVTASSPGLDLERCATLLPKLVYPDSDPSRTVARLDRMAVDLDPQIAPDDHPIKSIRTLNHYLFEKMRFTGQLEPLGDPDASYLNRVLENRRGLPIAISAIYILLGRRLDLPIVGVGMPAHFIVKYKADDELEIFVDPFNRGQILTSGECADILSSFGLEFEKRMLAESSDREIITRMMVNLIATYDYLGDEDRSQSLRSLIRILQGEED